MQPTGVFISFEGIDGAGKSSHIQALSEAFRQQGREVVQTREPGGTALAEKLRDMVLHQPMDALTEALLIFAARRDHLQTVIQPALDANRVVLCDRFTDATFAYQGAGRGVAHDKLATLERWVQGNLQPDLTIIFDLPPAVGRARAGSIKTPDRFEQENEAFFGRVRDGYLQRAREAPQRVRVVDASHSIGEVQTALALIVEDLCR